MKVFVVVRLKSTFEEWKALFDQDSKARAAFCDENQTLVGKVNDHKATVALFDVDMEEMGKHLSNPEFQKMIDPYVEGHDVYTMEPLG